MKINDVIECVNKALDKERKAKLIEARGHFVFHINYERMIGSVKKFKATIEFISYGIGDNGVPKTVCGVSYVTDCPVESIEQVKDRITLMLLDNFFYLLRAGTGEYNYDNFVNGTFNGTTEGFFYTYQ